MTVWTFVQARLGSTRLPRKVLQDIGGESMVERVMRRAESIGYPVALLIPKEDRELAGLALAHEWTYLEGPEEDVLARFAGAVEALRPDHVIRVCGDCPFVSPEWARWTLEDHLRSGADLTWDQAEGRGVQVFKADAILRADRGARPHERHSPDVHMLDWPTLFDVRTVKCSVDTLEDLETARRRIV